MRHKVTSFSKYGISNNIYIILKIIIRFFVRPSFVSCKFCNLKTSCNWCACSENWNVVTCRRELSRKHIIMIPIKLIKLEIFFGIWLTDLVLDYGRFSQALVRLYLLLILKMAFRRLLHMYLCSNGDGISFLSFLTQIIYQCIYYSSKYKIICVWQILHMLLI